jgi:hypothetical protein
MHFNVTEQSYHPLGFTTNHRSVLRRNRAALPGVRSASLANYLPLGTEHNVMNISARELPPESPKTEDGRIAASAYNVAPGYFPTMGTMWRWRMRAFDAKCQSLCCPKKRDHLTAPGSLKKLICARARI